MTTQEEPTEKTKKKSKKSKPVKVKKTLVDLVEASNLPSTSIVMDLSENNLLEQYRSEVEAKELGIPIVPSLTEDEFKKIIGD